MHTNSYTGPRLKASTSQRFVDCKSWKANELIFYDNKLDGLKSMKVKLEERHTTIITNCNLLTAGKVPPKVMQRNNGRENTRACDVTKIITSGIIKYESPENDAEKSLK
jgi:hypothetical protein